MTSKTRRPVVTPELVATWGAAAINKNLDRLERESSAITDALIAAGRGSERPSEMRGKTDPLTVLYFQNVSDADLLRDEVRRRYGPGAPRRLPPGFRPLKSR